MSRGECEYSFDPDMEPERLGEVIGVLQDFVNGDVTYEDIDERDLKSIDRLLSALRESAMRSTF